MSASEAEIMRAVQLRLGARDDTRLWRQNVGQGWVRAGATFRPQTFGVPGQPDLMGCAIVRGVAVWLGVETKAAKGTMRATQRSWQQIMTAAGGIYILTRDPDDAEAQLERAITAMSHRMDASK